MLGAATGLVLGAAAGAAAAAGCKFCAAFFHVVKAAFHAVL